MDAEQVLLARVLIDGDFSHVTDQNLRSEHFKDEYNRDVFEFVRAYNAEHASVPPITVIRADFPDFPIKATATKHSVAHLGTRIRAAHVYGELTEALADAHEGLTAGNPVEVHHDLLAALTKMAAETAVMRDTNVTTTWKQRLDRYREARDNPGLLGIPTGFGIIDAATLGLQRQQLITVVGLPGGGKSTLLVALALAAHQADNAVVFIGFEMTNDEQSARFDAQRAHVDHHKILAGEMTPKDEQALTDAGLAAEDMPPFIMTEDPSGLTTVSAIGSKIAQHRPAVVFIDGVYLMDDENGEAKGSPQALTNITRSLKRLAQRHDIPIVITTQALENKTQKRQGLTTYSVGYSSSFVQDSDIVFGVEVDPQTGVQKISTLKVRQGPRVSAFLEWNWARGTFKQLADQSGQSEQDDEAEMVEEDDEEDDVTRRPGAGRPPLVRTMRGKGAS